MWGSGGQRQSGRLCCMSFSLREWTPEPLSLSTGSWTGPPPPAPPPTSHAQGMEGKQHLRRARSCRAPPMVPPTQPSASFIHTQFQGRRGQSFCLHSHSFSHLSPFGRYNKVRQTLWLTNSRNLFLRVMKCHQGAPVVRF